MKIKNFPKVHLLTIAAFLIILAVSPISAAAQTLSTDFAFREDPGQTVNPVLAGIELNVYDIAGRFVLRADIAVTDQYEEPLAGALVNLEITQVPAELDPYKDYQGRVRYLSNKTNADGTAIFFTKYRQQGKWTVCVDSIEYEGKIVFPGENAERCSVITG